MLERRTGGRGLIWPWRSVISGPKCVLAIAANGLGRQMRARRDPRQNEGFDVRRHWPSPRAPTLARRRAINGQSVLWRPFPWALFQRNRLRVETAGMISFTQASISTLPISYGRRKAACRRAGEASGHWRSAHRPRRPRGGRPAPGRRGPSAAPQVPVQVPRDPERRRRRWRCM